MSDQTTGSIIMDSMDIIETSTPEPTSSNLDLDLDTLWEMLDRHRLLKEGEQLGQHHINTTWELVIVQGVLLTLLVILAIVWAVFCRRRCGRGQDQEQLSVSEALRKVSAAKRDVPCSYSRTDINSLGISVNDYLNPPPAYLDLFTDNLQYLDLEQGHNRLAKLSFCSEDGSVARLARLSVASCENCSSEAPVVVPLRPDRSSAASVSSASSSASSTSRRSSRNSRVSFSEEVECSNGSIRRLSTNSLVGLKTTSKENISPNTDNKKSSLKSNLKRKFGSMSDDGFISNLDDDLKLKLESSPAQDDPIKNPESEAQLKAETQAERAARICDIIVEEK